jgi:hypothetical protein
MTYRYNFRVIIIQYIVQKLGNAFQARPERPLGLTFARKSRPKSLAEFERKAPGTLNFSTVARLGWLF